MLGNAIAADQVRGVLAFAIMTASFLWKMRTEEAFMRDAFGEKYTAYKQRVAALIPGVW
jgi:protein-S-isoprenylcysteine O-methyltransferase Ste14